MLVGVHHPRCARSCPPRRERTVSRSKSKATPAVELLHHLADNRSAEGVPTMNRYMLGAVAVVLLLAGCESKTTDPPANQSISIALAAASGEVTQGGTLDVAVNLTRAGGFTGPVTLSAEGLPGGVTAASGTIAANATSGTITLTADGAAAPATANATIRATGSGVSAATAALALTVRVRGAYTLAAQPATVTLAQGATGSAAIAINRTGGFTGTVALAATAPTGITATLTPASVAGTTATAALGLTVAGTVAPGTYPVTVTGTTAGLTNQTTTVNVTVTAAGSFTLAVTPASLSVAAGSSGAASVAITRLNGFTGAVSLSATAPTGITATLDPASATGATAALNVAVGAAVAAGSHTVTINGTAAGIAQQTATLTVNVTAAGGFSIALSPTALAVQQGSASTSQVTVTRTGAFTGDVALTATTPTGVTASFAPATLSGAVTQSTMTVSAGATAPTGPAQVTVRANATGQAEQTAALALTVNASTGGAGNVSFAFCALTGVPQFVAAQDGNGAWTRITGTVTNTYSFQVSSGRGGVAYVVPAVGGGWEMHTFHGTTAEMQTQGQSLCGGKTSTGKTVTGSVTPTLGALETANITLGNAQARVGGGGSAFTLTSVIDGALDLVATRSALDMTTFASAPNRILIQRNLNPAHNSSLGVLDFATGVAPAQATLTFGNVMGDWTGSFGFFRTNRDTHALLYNEFGMTAAATRQWYGVPAAQRVAGDVHMIMAMAMEPIVGESEVTQSRIVTFLTTEVAPKTIEFGPRLPNPTVTVTATQPYVRVRIAHTLAAPYDRYVNGMVSQGENAAARVVSMAKTAGYISAGGSAPLEVPDLTGVSGWNSDWGLKGGARSTWTLQATGWSGTGVATPVLVDGAIMSAASRMGEITP
jgi:hypothetical protein